jgi:hypothetical protein
VFALNRSRIHKCFLMPMVFAFLVFLGASLISY